jgi:hypothetical protein
MNTPSANSAVMSRNFVSSTETINNEAVTTVERTPAQDYLRTSSTPSVAGTHRAPRENRRCVLVM